MKKNIFVVSILFLFFFFINEKNKTEDFPVPIEIIQKKKNKKQFKQERNQWILDMHKSTSDLDWKQQDIDNRKLNTDAVREKRKSMLNQNMMRDIADNYETILERDIEGTWIERGSNNLAGRIMTADIDFENNLIYCASAGGNIWKGTLDGEDWQSLTDYMQLWISFLRIFPTDNGGQRLLIGTDNNFYFSDNDAITLNESNGLGNYSIKRFIMQSGTNNIYALVNSSPKSIYVSTDLGENFEYLLPLNQSQGVSGSIGDFDIFTPRYFEDYIYLLNNDSLFKIDGDNLIFISNFSDGQYSGDVALTGGVGVGGTFLYAYVDEQIFKSINGGNSFANKGIAPSTWWWINGFNSSNLERDKVFIGGMELFGTPNGGDDWSLVNPWWEYYDNIEGKLHADIPEIRFFLDEEYNEVALISTDGGLYFSENYLETVQNISLSGLGVSQYYSTYSQRFYPYAIYAGSQDQGFQKSITLNEGIQDFEQTISGDYGHLVSGDNGISVWANYPGFTIYYPDLANSNSSLSLNFPGSGHLWLAPLMSHPYSSEKAILGGGGINGGNHLFELTVNGNQINYEELDYNFLSTVSAMGFSPIDPSFRYVLTENGKFYYSVDDGENWTMTSSFTGPSSHYFYGSTIWASPQELGKVYIGGSGYSNSPVYVSYDHGQIFESMDEGLPNTLVYQLAGTPDDIILFAATEIGPYAYSENENQWFFLSGVSAPDQTYWSVDYISEINTARFGTYGRGIWDFVLSGNYYINLGDVNEDNNVNIQDVIIIINFILENLTPNQYEFSASDINEDGVINVLDIVLIVDIIFED